MLISSLTLLTVLSFQIPGREGRVAGRLRDLRAGDVEVVRPVGAVGRRLPGPVDGAGVLGKRPDEPLRERQRREVRRVAHERPRAVAEAHGVHANYATRVEVVLGVADAVGVDRDDAEAVGKRWIVDLGALEQEPALQ